MILILNRLYELIWKRTMASQMSDAELEKTTAKINISTNNEQLTASGEVIKFDGFLKVYMESTDDDEEDEDEDESRLPNLTVGQVLEFKQMTATERFTKHAATIYRSLAGKETGRTGHWQAKYLCPYHFYHYEKRLCREKR